MILEGSRNNLFDQRLVRDLETIRQEMVDSGELPEKHFEAIEEAYRKYLKIRKEDPDRGWPSLSMVAFVEAAQPRLMLKAWATLRNQDSQDVDSVRKQAEAEYGPDFFRARAIKQDIPIGLPIHETVVDMGAVSKEDVEHVRQLRRDIQRTIGIRLFLGTLLVRMSLITVGEYYQAVALHYGLPFEDVSEDALSEIAAEWTSTGDLDTTTLSGFLGDP